MPTVIPVPQPITLPIVATTERFPVRRVYCVGRNYAEHAREMGHDPERESPFFFMKPTDAVLSAPNGSVGSLPYPPKTDNFHFEVELVVALKSGGSAIPVSKALDCIFGYAAGLDMTRRDLQAQAKTAGQPWELAKSADFSAPIGLIAPVESIGHLQKGSISLSVDGTLRQNADLADMIWSVAEQISFLSSYFALNPGDIIFSGTPSGVGPVERGQTIVAKIDTLPDLSVKIV